MKGKGASPASAHAGPAPMSREKPSEKNRIHDIPCIEEVFDSEDEAALFCIRANAKRRHLTDAELLKAISEADRIMKKLSEEKMRAGRGVDGSGGRGNKKTLKYADVMMGNRLGQRLRDYEHSKYADDDFSHCDLCGVEGLKTELTKTTREEDSDVVLYVCPLCLPAVRK